jgi:serine/threonine protein kinase
VTEQAGCPDLEALVDAAAGTEPSVRDPALARHVESCQECTQLLAELRAEEELAQRLSRAFAPSAADGTPARGLLPILPGYRILSEIGRGGMGVVYAGEEENTRRKSALKVVRGRQYVNESTLKLFQREIRALARLRHPGIAQLYAAGCTPEGEHFFAMELVEGESLLRHARAAGLDRRARLAIFARICDAIHHAHQQSVIHRDLKPSNILVDAHGEPRVLDFGLAKITDADASLATQLSVAGSIRGTLAYMSPEQAGGDLDTVDLRSDVHTQGVIQHELLTDALPYDVTSTRMHEAVRVIC